jgi:Domain of unknown function (DUF1906)
MTELKGIDIAWDRPTIAAIKATGAHWVARYFSPDATKNLTAAEVHDYPAAGLAIVTVFESSAGRATAGFAAGAADARLAEQQRAAVGLPASHIHHFAVDEDTSWASVQAYFDGAASVVGLARIGAYGGLAVIEGAAAHGLRYLWQTVAWSGGVWSPHATIRQPGGTLMAGAADIDDAEVPDFGQTPRPETNMPLTPADIQAIWDHAETNKASGQPVRMGTVLAWADFERQQEINTLTAQLGAVSGALTALSKAVATGGGLTPAQVTAAAQAGAAAALAELGHKLDGTPAGP